MRLKLMMALAITVNAYGVAFAQNQSTLKTTNQKNVNVQKKNDEGEMNRIRSKTPKSKDGNRKHRNDSMQRQTTDSMNK